MKTKADLVNGAYSQLLRTGVTGVASQSDMTLALDRLEDMMAEFETRMQTGYNFESPAEPSSLSGLEDWMNQAIITNLAMRVWPDFSPESVNQVLVMQANQSLSNMGARLASQAGSAYSRRMPIGSGQRPIARYRRFYGNYKRCCD
jgi:hypothetical protein